MFAEWVCQKLSSVRQTNRHAVIGAGQTSFDVRSITGIREQVFAIAHSLLLCRPHIPIFDERKSLFAVCLVYVRTALLVVKHSREYFKVMVVAELPYTEMPRYWYEMLLFKFLLSYFIALKFQVRVSTVGCPVLKGWIWRSYQCIIHTKLWSWDEFRSKSTDHIKKWIEQKLFGNKFPLKKSVSVYVYLPQKCS